MNEIIKINYENETVSARDLYDALKIKKRFSAWFTSNSQGFIENEDYKGVYLQVQGNQYGGLQEIRDYALTVEMAKHICLMSKTDEGKKCRKYLIELEKAWNTPEQVMARALKLADRTIYELKLKIEEQRQKVEYHDTVLNKDGLITTTVVAKDLGFKSAAKLNQIINLNGIIFKNKSGTWCPYAEYEWLITSGYADYKSYEAEKAKPCLKWTEKGRKWIVDNYNSWVMKLVG